MGNPLLTKRLQGRNVRRVSIATSAQVPWFGGSTLEQNDETRGNPQFGAYLRSVREGKRLSLDAVEELSAGFPEKVTKSHLSRVENGLALPTFPRLMAMSHIYGVPIASMAERYEIELRRGMSTVDLEGKSNVEIIKDVERLWLAGSYNDALVILLSLIDERFGDPEGLSPEKRVELLDVRIRVATCLRQLGRYEFAKTLCEELLGHAEITRGQRLATTLQFAICCYRLGRYNFAIMALDQVSSELDLPDTPRRLAGDLELIRGNVFVDAGTPDRALGHLERAQAAYDAIPNRLESCRAGLEIGEALIALGRLDEASRRIAKELQRAEEHGFERQRAIGFSLVATLSYKKGDLDSAERHALRSNAIARTIEHHVLVFRNCYYLWEIARQRGDASAAKLNERALRSYLGRIESKLTEAEQFRDYLRRGES
ncbi:MAG TPA: helix-turn-helix domain-containing protein [Candidatus Polarisedimenticolaceae bacterium]|nr:helix-turn-helix domain-containing protein [Candidatus Polarisedimenticolaceae bacterium]